MTERTLSTTEAAERAEVPVATLRRWASTGVIPGMSGKKDEGWSAAAIAHARVVSRLRQRGHTLQQIRRAAADGRLAYSFVEEMFPPTGAEVSLEEAAEIVGVEPALIERFWASIGLPGAGLERLTEADVQALRYAASVLAAGFPLVSFLQL